MRSSFQIRVFFRYIPRRQISISCGNSIFSFLRNPHTLFHSGYTSLHSHQQCRKTTWNLKKRTEFYSSLFKFSIVSCYPSHSSLSPCYLAMSFSVVWFSVPYVPISTINSNGKIWLKDFLHAPNRSSTTSRNKLTQMFTHVVKPRPEQLCAQPLTHIWLWDCMDCSSPGSPIHGIFQARILEWVAISYSKGSSWTE